MIWVSAGEIGSEVGAGAVVVLWDGSSRLGGGRE